MKNAILSCAFVLLLGVSLVPVSAWADSELAAGSDVAASDVVLGGAGDAVSDAVSEPAAEPDADSAAASGPAAESAPDGLTDNREAPADSSGEEWTVYEVTPIIGEDEASSEPVYTIWDKPFEEYTPTEGYLFLLFVLTFAALAFKLFKGGIL